MRHRCTVIACLILQSIALLASPLISWELPLLPDKPGTFKSLSRTDYAPAGCGFTRAEMGEGLKEITGLVDVMRKNPVLTDMKGFEGRARIYNVTCDDKGGYGLPARVSFEFASWFMSKEGKPTFIAIEPPEWSIVLNKPNPVGTLLGIHTFEGDLFMIPPHKETIQPGIDRYDGEVYVLYNPDRPAYWLPVTVNEAFDALRARARRNPDKRAAEYTLKFTESQYAAIPEADRNKPAHSTGTASANPSFPPIVRVNPEYWNKSLPRSAVQFLFFRMISNKKFLENRRKEALEGNSISYALYRFEESLDMDMVRSLVPLIRK